MLACSFAFIILYRLQLKTSHSCRTPTSMHGRGLVLIWKFLHSDTELSELVPRSLTDGTKSVREPSLGSELWSRYATGQQGTV